MANPSLQIGNSNWAIKEDNLLGYSTAGTRFVPQPITMTRASAGTRVNSSGLVETVELLGSEEVTNGDFATDSGWSTGAGWDINTTTNVADRSGETGNSPISQLISVVSGKTYIYSYTRNYISGFGETNIFSKLDNVSYTTLGSYNSTVVEEHTVTGTFVAGFTGNMSWNMYGIGTFTGSIDNVSVKEYTANNLARVDYDGTASSLLVEPERTNLIPYSEDFSQWGTQDKIILTPNSVSSPSGDVNAYKIIPTSTSGVHKVRENLSTVSGDYTLSIFAKQGEYKNILLWDDILSGGLGVNLDDLSIFRNQNNQSYNIEDYGSGWVRISVTLSYSSQQILPSLYIYDNSATPKISFAGNDIDGLYIWGSQIEEGSYPTSYIPTDGGTVTRVQDQYSKTGISNLIGQTEGTLFVDVDFDTLSGLNMFLSIRPNSSNKIEIYRSSDIIYGEIASTNSFSFSKIDVTVGRYKIAVAYSSGSSAMYINGVLMSSNSTSFAFTSTLNDLYVGSRGGTSFIEQAKYNDIKLYKTRLSNSELATLTT